MRSLRRSASMFTSISSQAHPFGGRNTRADWEPLIAGLGIRYYRTAYFNNASNLAYLSDFFTSYAIKYQLLMNPIEAGSYNTTTMTALLNLAESIIGTEKIDSFEGPNEINQDGRISGDWAQKTVLFQQAFYEAVRARPAFDTVRIGGPSIWGRRTVDINEVLTKNAGLGWAPICDWQPVHNYTGGRKPTIGGAPLMKGGETGDPNAEVTLDFTLADHQRLAPTKQLQMTEWGQSAADGAVAANAFITSEAAMSKYVSRGLLEN